MQAEKSLPPLKEGKEVELQKRLDLMRRASRTPTLKSQISSSKEVPKKSALSPSSLLAYIKVTLLKKCLVSFLRFTGKRMKMEISAKI